MSQSDLAGGLPAAPLADRAIMAARPAVSPPLLAVPVARPVGSQVNVLALLRALRRRWVLATVCGLVCATIAVAVAWAVIPPSKYTARALLHVSSQVPHIIFQTAEQRADFMTYQRTQLTLIKSRLVLNSALNDDEVRNLPSVRNHPDPILWLEKEIKPSYSGEVLSISMSGENPGVMKALVNAVARAYLREVVSVEANERRQRYEDLRQIYSTYNAKLQEKREVLRKLAEQVGSTEKETVRLTHEIAIERRAQMQSELLRIRVELRSAEAELAVKSQNGSLRSASAQASGALEDVEALIEGDRYMEGLVSEAEHLMAQKQRLHTLARQPLSDPVGQRLDRELAANRQKQDARREQLREWYASRATRPQAVQPAPAIAALSERIQILKLLEKLAEADVNTLSDESRSIHTNSLELETLNREIEHQEVASKRVGNEVEALSIELNAPARVRLLEEADAPRLEADKRPMMAGMAGLGALGLAICGITLLEYQARRIGAVDEVVHHLGLRLVGSLPDLPAERPRRWLRGHHREYQEELLIESVDATRTIILRASEAEAIQVVMVTSALGGEGKTSLSCHLATSLARAGRSTLLLDGDLRRPSVHQVFGLEGKPGFAELLRGEVPIDAAIQAAPDGGPWVIPAGVCDNRAIQALSHRDLAEGFQKLRERFEFIIVDTSPVLPVADALQIGQHADAAICSILQGVSRAPKVIAANERLTALGIRVLGAVLAGTHNEGYSSAYHCPISEQS